jgi:hypothetical protein
MSKYFVMSGEDALKYLKARDNGDEPLPDDFQRTHGAGELMNMAAIDKLGSELRKLKKSFPTKLRKADPEGGHFEQQACSIVHRALPSSITTFMVAERVPSSHTYPKSLTTALARS